MSDSRDTRLSIAPPRILAITPADLDPSSLREVLPDLAGLVDAVHLRWPKRSTREIHDSALSLAEVHPRPALLVNDRADVAAATGLEGVHLRDDGIAPGELPPQMRPRLVGLSRHDEAGVRRVAGADYVVVSPVLITTSKPGAKPLGKSGLGALTAACPLPVLALGGMRAEDLLWVLSCGAFGVAVLSGILGADDPVARARAYRNSLEEALRFAAPPG